MRTLKISVAVVMASALLAATGFGSTPANARFISAAISVDGTVVLKGSTSDDGHPDVDAVWDYLKTLALKPTEDFADLEVPDNVDEFLIVGTPTGRDQRTGRIERARDVKLHISYGGWTNAFKLQIVRAKARDGAAAWRVHPDELEGFFSMRNITRREARLLEDPDRRR